MRILFVAPNLFRLGDAFQLNLLARRLTAQRHDVHAAVLDAMADFDSPPLDGAVTVHELDVAGVRDITAPWRLRRLINRLRPEILHTWCEPASTLGLLATQGAPRLQVFVTEMQFPSDNDLCPCWLYRQLCRRAQAVIVPHEALCQGLTAKGVNPEIMRVIPNGVETTNENDAGVRDQARQKIIADWNLPHSAYIAATVAPFEPCTRIKDLLWVTDTFACFRDDVYFLLIGDGPQRWRLKKFMRSTGAEPYTRFVGNANRSQEYFPGLDVYWHSHHNQPLANGILLAMANAVPVISVYGPGADGLIRHQQTGLAVNTGARVEFGRWTKYLIETPALARQLGRQGQQHVANHFGAGDMADSYLQLYQQG